MFRRIVQSLFRQLEKKDRTGGGGLHLWATTLVFIAQTGRAFFFYFKGSNGNGKKASSYWLVADIHLNAVLWPPKTFICASCHRCACLKRGRMCPLHWQQQLRSPLVLRVTKKDTVCLFSSANRRPRWVQWPGDSKEQRLRRSLPQTRSEPIRKGGAGSGTSLHGWIKGLEVHVVDL